MIDIKDTVAARLKELTNSDDPTHFVPIRLENDSMIYMGAHAECIDGQYIVQIKPIALDEDELSHLIPACNPDAEEE